MSDPFAEDRPVGNPWFGEPWPRADYRAPVCEDDRLRIPVPVGQPCCLCGHDIQTGDRGTAMGAVHADRSTSIVYQHNECGLRSVLGCSAHLRGEPHDHDGDYREDARKVVAWVEGHGRMVDW